MIIDQQKAASLVASFGFHKKVGSLVSTSQMAAFADCQPEQARRILMNGIMSGSMRLVKSSGGNIVAQVIGKEEQRYNALMLEASTLSECSRIQSIADSM